MEREKGREGGGQREGKISPVDVWTYPHLPLCCLGESVFCFGEAYHCFLCLLTDCHTLSGHLSYSGASLLTPQGLRKSAMHPEFSRGRLVSITFRERRAIFFQLGDTNLP